MTLSNFGTQKITFDFKTPVKGSYFTEQLYSLIKPGIYKGLDVTIAQSNPVGNQIDISTGQAFLNCIFEVETKRSIKVDFQTSVSSYTIAQVSPGINQIVYLLYEYKEVVENWVEIASVRSDLPVPDNAIILCECIYDGSGNITEISYDQRQYGFFNSDDDYSITDSNIFSNALDETKKFRFSASGISGTNIVREIIIPDHDYSLNTINDWLVDTTYKEKEVVVYNNTLYRCVTEHTSIDFFSDLSNWENITSVEDEEKVRGYNNSGSTLSQGVVVKVSGDYPTEEIPEIDLISDYLDEPFGIVVNDILNSNSGEIIQRGRIELPSYDFSLGVVGQKIYCDDNGDLTLSVTSLIVGQLLDPVNSIIYVSILPAEEGLNVVNFNGQLSVNENTIQKAFDRIDDFGYLPIWVTSQSYRVGNSITKDGIIYTCLIAHTSGTFSTDLTANRWLKVQNYLDTTNLNGQLSPTEDSYQKVVDRLDDYGYAPIWVTSKDYRIGNIITKDGIVYTCLVNHTSGTFSTDLSNNNWLKVQSYFDVSNLNGQLASGIETSYQLAIDRLEDYGYLPIWETGKTYRVGNSIRRIDDSSNSIWSCITNHTSTTFSSDISNWIALTDSTALKSADVQDLTSTDSNISVSGGIGSVIENVQLTLNPNPILERINIQELSFTNYITVSTSGQINNLDIDNYSFIRFTNASSLTGIVSPNPSGTKIIIISNVTGSSITINNESSSSSADNRILTGTGSDLTLGSNSSILLVYDLVNSNWRIVNGNGLDNYIIRKENSLSDNTTISITSIFGSQIAATYRFKDGSNNQIYGTIYFQSHLNYDLIVNGDFVSNISGNEGTVNIYVSSTDLIFENQTGNTINLVVYREV